MSGAWRLFINISLEDDGFKRANYEIQCAFVNHNWAFGMCEKCKQDL